MKILFSISHAFQKRMFISSGLISKLLQKGHKIVVFSNIDIKSNEIKNGDNLEINFIKNFNIGKVNTVYLGIRRIFLWKYSLMGSPLNYANFLKGKSKTLYTVAQIGRLLPHSIRLKIDSCLMKDYQLRSLLLKYKPDLLIFATGFLYQDAVLNYEASRLGIKRIMIGQSWDNFSTKSYTNPKPDLLICWGQRMAEEAIKYNDFEPDKIIIAGVPHFDIYHKLKELGINSRIAREKLGLNPDYKTIVYGTSSESICPDETIVVTELAKIVNSSPNAVFGEPIQMIVRIHPGQFISEEKAVDVLKGLESDRIRVEIPIFENVDEKEWTLSPEDSYKMGLIFRASNIAINCFSTFSLDALANDLPVIIIGFDLKSRKIEKSVKRYMNYIHIEGLLYHNGINVANSFEEMLSMINEYLDNPNLKLRERRNTIEYELYKVDGKTVDRIVEIVEKA